MNDFIQVEFNLPDYTEELKRAEQAIDNVKSVYEKLVKRKNINADIHDKLYERLIRVLDLLGKISTPTFEIEDQLEEIYFKHYLHQPNLAKQLWLEHYESLHRPYSQLKNKCFRLLDLLDEEYITIHKTFPPNWNY